eukprot:13661030-Alexandrium_andersonii.AAC.1
MPCHVRASQAALLFWWLLLAREARVLKPIMVPGSRLTMDDQTVGHSAVLSAWAMGLHCLPSFFS